MSQPKRAIIKAREVLIPCGTLRLEGELIIPEQASGVVLFAHGSGSSRHSPRNKFVARTLHNSGIGTLLFDLLTLAEEEEDRHTGHLRFDISLLSRRLIEATEWLSKQKEAQGLPVGFFGSSTGAAAALVAAADLGSRISAVVSRGGRPDLAGTALPDVVAPTLLIVGGRDNLVIQLNWDAFRELGCQKKVEIVGKATHLFEEPGALEEVARLAADWFRRHFESHARAVGA